MKIARATFIAVLIAAVIVPAAASSAPPVRAAEWIPLSAPAPAWYTPELHRKVLASGVEGVAVPESAAVPAGTAIPASSLAFLGIRPGQLIIVNGGTLCSSNFVFRNGANYAIGTAGHCGRVGHPVTLIAGGKLLFNIGTIIKTVDQGPGNDFALISIKPEFNSKVSPSMAHWGGPIGAWPGGVPGVVKHSGHGLGIGTGGTPRLGLGWTWNASGLWTFLGAINKGDSGSAADSGNQRAVGNITHIMVTVPPQNAGTTIQRILQIAGMPLATCKSGVPWPLFGCPSL